MPYKVTYNGSVDGSCSAGENNEIAFAFAKTLNKNDVKTGGGSESDENNDECDGIDCGDHEYVGPENVLAKIITMAHIVKRHL